MHILKKLENANIRSWDLLAGEAVLRYIDGAMPRSELRNELRVRRQELRYILRKIDKLLVILRDCPIEVKHD